MESNVTYQRRKFNNLPSISKLDTDNLLEVSFQSMHFLNVVGFYVKI